MLQKLISTGTVEERNAHEKTFGKYNDAPPNLIEIDEKEFAQCGFFTWCVEGQETRQICRGLDPKKLLAPIEGMLAITLFYMNTGIHYGLGHDFWKGKVRYFKFAVCHHTFVEIGVERMMHSYKCTKCNHIMVQDTSD